MFSKVFYLTVFVFLLHSSPAFSLEGQASPLGTCKKAFYSLFNIRKNSKKPVVDSVTTVDNVATEPGKKREVTEHEHNTSEGIEAELKEWGSRPIQNRLIEGELKIPQRIREERTLKEQGFNSEYIRGIDEMNEMIAVAQRLRELEVNPYTTHIDYFANKIKERIRFMKDGAVDFRQRRRLELLRGYGETAIKEQSVTYEKWIQFNGLLAAALSGGVIKVGASLESIIRQFPGIILLPTTKGIVGFITISEGIEADIYILGLSNKQENKYDGVFGDSLNLFNHDLFHIRKILDAKNRTDYAFYEKMRKVREQIKNLSPEKRKQMEFIYWFLVYEKPETLPSYPLMIKSHLLDEMPSLYIRDGREGVEEVPKMVDDFMEVYSSI